MEGWISNVVKGRNKTSHMTTPEPIPTSVLLYGFTIAFSLMTMAPTIIPDRPGQDVKAKAQIRGSRCIVNSQTGLHIIT